MPPIDFIGSDRLIALLDAAVRLDDPQRTTQVVKHALCNLIRKRDMVLPACACQPQPGHYARRLLYRSEEFGYTVVAMTWGPGQGTPIHDHSGMWCVEGVWQGQIEVDQYELSQRAGDRYRFEYRGTVQAGVGSAGCLIPPHEYHRIRNALADQSSVSLHIYGGEMSNCHIFAPVDNDWYTRSAKPLSYTI